MTRPSRFLALVASAGLVLLAACSEPLPQGQERLPAPATDNPVTLTVWHVETGSAASSLEALAVDFQKAYPKISLQILPKANEGDLLRQGLAAVAMNQAPDIVIANPRTIAEFARKDALANLDLLLDDPALGLSAEERNDFIPGLLDAERSPDLKNQLFGFPFDERAIVLYYNADQLKTAKADTPPRTWDQFSFAARATTKGVTRGWVMVPDPSVFCSFLFSRGGSVLGTRDSQIQAQFDDDSGLKSLQLIVALTKGGAAYLVENVESARNDFVQGRAALYFGTTDELPLLSDSIGRTGGGFQWGMSNLPQSDPDHPLTIISGEDVAIFKSLASKGNGKPDEHVRAAWLFVRWLTTPEQVARWSRSTMSLPVRVSAQSLLAADLPPQLQRMREGFANLPSMRAVPTVNGANLIDAAIVEMWVSTANGADPSTSLKNAAARTNRILGQIR